MPNSNILSVIFFHICFLHITRFLLPWHCSRIHRYNDSVEKPSRRSPGPQSYDPDAIRKAPQSTHRKVAGVSFGTGKRPCNKKDTASCKMPSPAEYDPENIRRGLMFSKKGTSSVKFGTAQYKNRKLVDLPGPQVRFDWINGDKVWMVHDFDFSTAVPHVMCLSIFRSRTIQSQSNEVLCSLKARCHQ